MNKINAIAFYLPQYHPIPENDTWWGKGFTEWTNVVKAKPLFRGHYQPRLPADMGFYDLRLAQVRHSQAEMARSYGIYGFCYYYYWFSGKKLLERPLEENIRNGMPDFPFMVCWANENWTRRWDGSDDKILISQEYNIDDAKKLANTLLPVFSDKRYIRVYGKPVFAIYNVPIIPDSSGFINDFRLELIRNGMSVYLLGVEGFNRTGLTSFNKDLDASIEFQPFGETLKHFKAKYHNKNSFKYFVPEIVSKVAKGLGARQQHEKIKAKYFHRIDYGRYVDFIINNYRYPTEYKRFPGVSPFWDNSPRAGARATIFLNESPEKYGEWLAYHSKNFVPFSKEENFVFINAWNEWAEGNHLEPCTKWGLMYLEQTKRALSIE